MFNLLIHWAKVGLSSELEKIRLGYQDSENSFGAEYLRDREKHLITLFNRVLRFERFLYSTFCEEGDDT